MFVLLASNVSSLRREAAKAAEQQLRASQSILDEAVKANALARQQPRACGHEPEV